MNKLDQFKHDHMDTVIHGICQHYGFSREIHTGAVTYETTTHDPIYCHPAWLQYEDPECYPFPEDSNVMISIEWYTPEPDGNLLVCVKDYTLTWDTDTDVINYIKIMTDFLSDESNFDEEKYNVKF